MQIEALSAGWGVPAQNFDATVHSVFARACNLWLKSGGLIGLVAPEAGNHPRCFRLAVADNFDFTRYFSEGDNAACRGGVLRFSRDEIAVDLRAARPWRCGIASLALDPDRAEIVRACAVAWKTLAAHGGGLDFVRTASDRIAPLARSVAARDLEGAAAAAAARLVGFGIGLTPAGDDFLVGYLAALWSRDESDPEGCAFRSAFGARIAAAATATTPIARTYLEAAAAGEVAEPLAALAARIAGGAADGAIRAACARALAVGASSGADGVSGFLLGLRYAAFCSLIPTTRQMAPSST